MTFKTVQKRTVTEECTDGITNREFQVTLINSLISYSLSYQKFFCKTRTTNFIEL